MCGIAGIINFNNKPVNERSIRSMMERMKHRGPDDDGIYLNNNIGLGFVRLSIIDLSEKGHQPMFDISGRYLIIHNGEFFNYIELRNKLIKKGYVFKSNTDTEVILYSFIEWGNKCQHKFNGMWSFAIYDTKTNKLFISRDRYGIKPFYYFQNEEFFIFSSEIPSLLKVVPSKPIANMQSVFDYLVFNRTDQSENTFFKGINKMLHGHYRIIDTNKSNNSKFHRWYNLRKEVKMKKGTKFTSREFRKLFIDAIKIRLRSDVPIGVTFSGGLDSSAILSSLIHDFNMKEINTFSAVYGKGKTGDESEFIKMYSKTLKNMYYTTPTSEFLYANLSKFIRSHGEPVPNASTSAGYQLMPLVNKHAVVVLEGQGADEMLGGYQYFFGNFFKELFIKRHFTKLIREIYYYLKIHKSIFGIKTFIYFLLPSNLRTKLSVYNNNILSSDFINEYSYNNNISRNLYSSESLNEALLNHFEYKLEHLLKWGDLNSMINSVESRLPFLDHRLVESTLAFNNDLINKGMTKILLREAMQDILPEKLRLRVDKVGYDTPQDAWLRDEHFKKLIKNILESGKFSNRKIFKVDKLKNLYKQHLKGHVDHSEKIWKCINLELWFREFID